MRPRGQFGHTRQATPPVPHAETEKSPGAHVGVEVVQPVQQEPLTQRPPVHAV